MSTNNSTTHHSRIALLFIFGPVILTGLVMCILFYIDESTGRNMKNMVEVLVYIGLIVTILGVFIYAFSSTVSYSRRLKRERAQKENQD